MLRTFGNFLILAREALSRCPNPRQTLSALFLTASMSSRNSQPISSPRTLTLAPLSSHALQSVNQLRGNDGLGVDALMNQWPNPPDSRVSRPVGDRGFARARHGKIGMRVFDAPEVQAEEDLTWDERRFLDVNSHYKLKDGFSTSTSFRVLTWDVPEAVSPACIPVLSDLQGLFGYHSLSRGQHEDHSGGYH